MTSQALSSLFEQIRAPKTRYFEIPTGDNGQRTSTPQPSRRRLFLFVFFAILCFSGIWSLTHVGPRARRSGQGTADLSGSSSNVSSLAGRNDTKGLVIASYSEQNVSWLSAIPSEWNIYRYYMDDPNPPNGLSVPRNQGREAMAYLTYIVDHYDNLPKYIVFTHGHYQSWHQVEPLPAKIRALNLTSLDEESYISLRCADQMGCERQPYIDTLHPNWDGERGLRGFWKTLLPQYDPPRFLSFKCCAQFAITREMVLQRPKSEWVQIREPFLHEITGYGFREFSSDWVIGTFYEKYWHVLLGPSPENCPSITKCQHQFFSNAIVCDRGIDFANFEGDEIWQDIKCITAFDGLGPDEPADLKNFHDHLLDHYGELKFDRKAAEDARRQKLAAYDEALAEQKEAAAMPAPPRPGDANDRPLRPDAADEVGSDRRPAPPRLPGNRQD